MRNVVIYDYLIYIVLCYTQFYLGKYNISKYLPNIVLIMIVYIALKKGALQAEIIGFILGIILDVISIDIFGLKAMTFTILGYSCGKLLINFDSENIIIQIIAILLESLVYYIIINTMHFLFLYKYKQTMIFTLTYHPYSMLMSTGITIVTTPIIFKFLACLNKMLNK